MNSTTPKNAIEIAQDTNKDEEELIHINNLLEASLRDRIEFPLTIYPTPEEEFELTKAIAVFQESFKVKTPYIAVIKALIYTSKVLEARSKGKEYYNTNGYKRKNKK